MIANNKERTADDFFYFSLPLHSATTDLKSAKFFLWLSVCQLIVVPIYILYHGEKMLPLTYALMPTYLFLGTTSFLCLVTLLLFKTKIYEPLVYFMVSLTFLGIAFLLLIIGYAEFFATHNDMEVFNTLNLATIEQEKIKLITRLMLFPPVVFILSSCFHVYAILTGKTSKNYKNADKYKQNSKKFSKFVPLFFPLILAFTFLNNILDVTQGNLMIILFIAGASIFSVFAPSLVAISYMKKKFPTTYLEKYMKKDGGIK